MEFVDLTHGILGMLKAQGYTVLYSITPLSNENPTWYPEQVDIDWLMEIGSVELHRRSVPQQELHYLFIQDAIDNIRAEDLIGQVFLADIDLNAYL